MGRHQGDILATFEIFMVSHSHIVLLLNINSCGQFLSQWFELNHDTRTVSDFFHLVANHLSLKLGAGEDIPFSPPVHPSGNGYQVPPGIRPILKLTRIEVNSLSCSFYLKIDISDESVIPIMR